ncbi:hypothetical protein KDH83_30480 [Achromobacter sp. Marseille-Q0513]|uniref:hypothetical protein n=1 Tax=Achromobacter sp. Marseille-Q0513 TaxID=2829161 RepID=UPI001B9C0B4B|nr:hypothetical protein [Achromobacter sp. Marseille-Q0513]MBR8657649.1 hypothetical protein [Achromobacter sp. Marseille-Q0513]
MYLRGGMSVLSVALACAWPWSAAGQGLTDCGAPVSLTGKAGALSGRVFPDGTIALGAPLAVNPDGGSHSYTVGDHGFTYIANGLNRKTASGGWAACKTAECRADFLKAERQAFGPGTSEFCVFAMEVEPYSSDLKRVSCGDGRSVIGNGKGKLKFGAMAETATGERIQTYVSTTSLRHTIAGQPAYLDSESLPVLVTPRDHPDLLGRVALVRGAGLRDTYAVFGDTGPAFGEGSIALHQLLRYGAVSAQRPGPIAASRRCGPEEAVLPPFRSSPDVNGDVCRPGRQAQGATDIRGYAAIQDRIQFLILPVRFGGAASGLIPDTVNLETIAQRAAQAGYTPGQVAARLACIPRRP